MHEEEKERIGKSKEGRKRQDLRILLQRQSDSSKLCRKTDEPTVLLKWVCFEALF